MPVMVVGQDANTGGATSTGIGKAPVDLVSSWVRGPGDINASVGNGSLIGTLARARANLLYSLGMQLSVLVDLSAYPLYALSSQFQTDLTALATNFNGASGPYGNLYLVLHDGVENYNSSTTKANMTAPLTAVPGSYLGSNFLTITYQTSGGAAFVGTPVLQNGDTVYLDDCIGLEALDANGNPTTMPSGGFLVNGCTTNTDTGISTFNVITGSTVVRALNPAVIVLPQLKVTTTSGNPIVTVPPGVGLSQNLVTSSTVTSPTTGLIPSGTTVTAFDTSHTLKAGPGQTIGTVLSSGLVTTATISGLPTASTLTAATSAGTASFSYTGISGATFTGCTQLTALDTGSTITTSGYGVATPFHITLSNAPTASASNIELDFTLPTDTGFTTAVLGGQLKTDSTTAVLHGTASTYPTTGIPAFPGSTSTADYLAALTDITTPATGRSNFASVRNAVKGAYNQATVALGLTGTQWNNANPTWNGANQTVSLAAYASALSVSDFYAFSLSSPYSSQAALYQSLQWASAQLAAAYPGLKQMVSWFDLYDPTSPLWKDYPLAAYAPSFAPSIYYGNLSSAFSAFLASVFNNTQMRTLTNNGLFAWNFYNDDYLNIQDVGDSYAALVNSTATYAVPQHSFAIQPATAFLVLPTGSLMSILL